MDNLQPPADGMLPMDEFDLLTALSQPTSLNQNDRTTPSIEQPANMSFDTTLSEPLAAIDAARASPAQRTSTPDHILNDDPQGDSTNSVADATTAAALSIEPQATPAPTTYPHQEGDLDAPSLPTSLLSPLADAEPALPAIDLQEAPSTPPRSATPTRLASPAPASPLSDAPSSPLSDLPSSPLSDRSSFTDDTTSLLTTEVIDATEASKHEHQHRHRHEPQELIDCAYERDGPEGKSVLRLRPTAAQWEDFPAILAFAKHHGALDDGCFRVMIPAELNGPPPDKPEQIVPARAYRPKKLKNSFWRIDTVPADGTYSDTGEAFTATTQVALSQLKRLFGKNDGKRIRDTRYRVDVPAWTPELRQAAGVPERSPIHPLKGDELDFTKAIIPGIHTPYVYESAAPFGATFQIHAEDFKLISLNHLYKGRKIWVVIPSTAIDVAERAFSRGKKCAQFMRHRAEFIFPDKLDRLGVPYRVVDQRPGETVVILPDAYHQGFSTGYTLAEAKNYADAEWRIDEYQPCEFACGLKTAIPAMFMGPLKDGEERLDLCARYFDPLPAPPVLDTTSVLQTEAHPQPAKREHEGESTTNEGTGHESKRVKVE